MDDLHFFGDKVDYEVMIKDMVLDHQILLDWIEQQDNLNNNQITAAGYSMGGQISLILASIDKRIKKVISIVPPFIDDKTALVVPKNFIFLLKNQQVLFVTADDDENATEKENDYIYHLIPTSEKERIQFAGGHILLENYVDSLIGKFAS